MDRWIGIATLACIAGCGPATPQSSSNKHAHHRPLSVDEHEAEAKRHDQVADAEQRLAAGDSERVEVRCPGESVESQTQIGGEPVRFAHPCFTSVINPSKDHVREARENRLEARKHRNAAKHLREAEATGCTGLDEEAMSHSPFYHHEDIAEIAVLEDNGQAVGVRITFKPVKGLTSEWLSRTLTCHKARAAALGYPASYMTPHCMSSVQDAEFEVTETNDRVSVAIRGTSGAAAATILGRALGLQAIMKKVPAPEPAEATIYK